MKQISGYIAALFLVCASCVIGFSPHNGLPSWALNPGITDPHGSLGLRDVQPSYQKLVHEIAQICGLSTDNLYAKERQGGDGVYAMAVRHGNTNIVYLNQRLLENCSEDEKQFLVGHEIAHLLCQHETYPIPIVAGLTGGVAALVPHVSLRRGIAVGVACSLIAAWCNRRNEFEADKISAQKVQGALEGGIQFFQHRIAAGSDRCSWYGYCRRVQFHPSYQARLEQLISLSQANQISVQSYP